MNLYQALQAARKAHKENEFLEEFAEAMDSTISEMQQVAYDTMKLLGIEE